MSLSAAIEASLELKECLGEEIARAQAARRLLKAMDTSALLTQAAQREAFNELTARLSERLSHALAAVAAGWGLDDVSLDELVARAPFEGAQLASVLAEVRARSASLAELDAFNRTLAERALSYVKAYVSHLAPRPSAYSRRGLAGPLGEASTYSEHA